MPNHAYEEINHTADIALRVWGNDFYALLSHAVEGMYDLMGVEGVIGSRVENAFSLVDDSLESVLVDFLNECLYLAEDRNQSFDDFTFNTMSGKLYIHAYGTEIRSIERQIKAVTFHELEIIETPSGLETTITFDV